MPHPPLSAGEWTFDGKRAPLGAPFFAASLHNEAWPTEHMNAVSTAPPSDFRPVSSHASGYAFNKPSPPVVETFKPTGSQPVLLIEDDYFITPEAVEKLPSLVNSRESIAYTS